MAFNFEVNPVAINNITKTLENLKNSIKLQDKIVEIDSNGQEIITADSEYDGLGKVTINTDVPTKPEEVLTETITENGLKTFNPTAGSVFSSASITVNVPEKKIEAEKTVSITENKETVITPTPDNDGMARVVVTTNIPQPTLEENKTQTISSNSVVEVTPSAGNDGMKKATITVNVPEKKIEANKTQSIITNGETVITPTAGNDGMAKVTVNVNVPTGGSGFDFSVIGYDGELQQQVNDGIQADINYSKEKYTEWDPQTTSANRLYNGDTKLVYAPNIDTSNVTDMYYMFRNCNRLKVVPELNTSKVTDMTGIFSGCTSLTEQPNFDYSKVTKFASAFENTNIDVFNLTFDDCTNLQRAFQGASGIHMITINNGNNLVDLGYCFNEANVANIGMNAGGTSSIPVSSLNLFMYQAQSNCNFMNDITFLLASCTKMDYAFCGSNITVTPKFKNGFSGSSANSTFAYCLDLIEVKDVDFGSATSLMYLFQNDEKLTTIGFLKVPNVTYVFELFQGCSSLTTIAGLEGLQTDISFSDCANLSNESIQNLIDNAADVTSLGTRTMTFNATPFATITEEQRGAATAKGWTLASA